MDSVNVFVSVGATATDEQEAFVRAIEDRLRSENLVPHTVGRNKFSSDAPLKAITELMDDCCGTVVIALERSYFPTGLDRRGPNEQELTEVKLPTPWNQIEATMSYVKNKPLLVLIEHGLKSEGILERGYDWYVQWVTLDPEALHTQEFNGVLASWKGKLADHPADSKARPDAQSPANLTIAQLVGGLKPNQLWSLIVALAALIGGAFALGSQLFVGS